MPLLHQLIHAGKAAVALAAAFALSGRSNRAVSQTAGSRRSTDMGLALAAAAAVLAWTNFGYVHFAGVIHPHDLSHNYLGAKYAPELGYTGLYRCVAQAELELGRDPRRVTSWVRDLETNRLVPVDQVFGTSGCERFSPARWRDFVADVRLLRSDVEARHRRDFYSDHGFNGSPAWQLGARALASLAPQTRTGLVLVVLFDWLLLVVMFAIIAREFGWRVLAVALVWWGTAYLTRYHFTGGGLLRNDWLLLTVVSIVGVRRGAMAAGGFTCVWAALLRLFPGVIAIGYGLGQLGRARRRRSPLPGGLRFAAGALLALAIIVPSASRLATGRWFSAEPWRAFQANTTRLLQGPFTNRVGLKAVLSWRPETRLAEIRNFWLDAPGDLWRQSQRDNLQQVRWLYWLVLAAYVAVLATACVRSEPWVAMVLSLGLVPFALDSSVRYFGFLLAFAFLSPIRPWVGSALAWLALGTLVSPALLRNEDDAYALTSLMVVAFVAATTIAFAVGRREGEAPADSLTQS